MMFMLNWLAGEWWELQILASQVRWEALCRTNASFPSTLTKMGPEKFKTCIQNGTQCQGNKQVDPPQSGVCKNFLTQPRQPLNTHVYNLLLSTGQNDTCFNASLSTQGWCHVDAQRTKWGFCMDSCQYTIGHFPDCYHVRVTSMVKNHDKFLILCFISIWICSRNIIPMFHMIVKQKWQLFQHWQLPTGPAMSNNSKATSFSCWYLVEATNLVMSHTRWEILLLFLVIFDFLGVKAAAHGDSGTAIWRTEAGKAVLIGIASRGGLVEENIDSVVVAARLYFIIITYCKSML